MVDAAAVGRAASVLFLRTHARAERVHPTMLASGFPGPMPRAEALWAGGAAMVFLAALCIGGRSVLVCEGEIEVGEPV